MAWASSSNAAALPLLLLVASAFVLDAAAAAAFSPGRGRRTSVAWAGRRKVTAAMEDRPGSSPPQCARRCGRCTPCRPVYVAVPPPPSAAVPEADAAEYYPEAWRCTCGGRLYVP